MNETCRANIVESINALNAFKKTHTHSQALRELCECLIDEPVSEQRDLKQTRYRLQLFRDKFDRLIDANREFVISGNSGKTLKIKMLSGKETVDEKNKDLEKILNLITKCIKKIETENKKIIPLSARITKLLENLSRPKFNPDEYNNQIIIVAEKAIEPARQILLHADKMILESISVIDHFSKGLM